MTTPPTSVTHSSANVHGLVLYDSIGSPCARRCRITLIEKGLAWDTVEINLSMLEQRNPDYLRINPNGVVPTLAHGTRIVYESNVITEYLDDVFPDKRLYPDDVWEAAEVKMWQARELAMAKDYRPLMYARLMGPIVRSTRTLDEALAMAARSTSNPADLEWERRVWGLTVLTPDEEVRHEARLYAWLDHLDEWLLGREFVVGERFTQAEISLYPRVMMYAYVGMPITRERYPNVVRWMGALKERPSFARTLPPEEAKLQRLVRLPLLPFLKRFHQAGPDTRRPLHGLGAAAAGRLLRRAMKVDKAVQAGSEARRTIPQPVPGAIPPDSLAIARRVATFEDAPLTLHTFAHSPHGRRIELMLALHRLPFRSVEVDMTVMAHKAPDFLALNPIGEVPALVHGKRVLIDSLVIADYLDRLGRASSGRALFPENAEALARVRMWLALEQGMHKETRPLFYQRTIRPRLVARGLTSDDARTLLPSGIDPGHRDWWLATLADKVRFDLSAEMACASVLKKLDVVEVQLLRSPFLVGDAPSYADIAWRTRIQSLGEQGIEIGPARYPALTRWTRPIQDFLGELVPGES